MKTAQKILIIVILLAGFIFGVSFSTLYAQTHIYEGTACSCTLPIPLLIPTFSSLGIFVGAVVYYLMFPKFEVDKEKYKANMKVLLDILPSEEKEVFTILIENNGEITQSKISAKMGRVKAFRIIEKLKSRGLVEKESKGKTNIIKLKEQIRKIFI
ncbi:MAG: hypothetical protein QW051_00435 [Candidatus Aenigmatarchaeota archaeon]